MKQKTLVWFRKRFRILLIIAAIAGCAPAYVHAYAISAAGVSEVPTILAGDIVVVNNAAYDLTLPYSHVRLLRTGSPQRGDMVVIRVPTSGWAAPKRVIGIPGDTVEVRENRVVINDQPVASTPLDRSEFRWVPKSDKLGTVVESEDGHWISYTPGKSSHKNHQLTRLAPGQYFLLGDNRDESADSREWGPLFDNSILGKVMLVLPVGRRL